MYGKNTQEPQPENFEDLAKDIQNEIDSKRRKADIMEKQSMSWKAKINREKADGMQYVLDRFKKFIQT